MLTYRDDVVWSWNTGSRTVSPPQPVDSQTRFRVASVSKAFTAVALFKLAADNRLESVDSRIVDYEPSFMVRNPFAGIVGLREGKDLTFRMLAAHLSGIQREAPCAFANCSISTQSILQFLQSNYLTRPPNSKPSYSNLAYALLGNLLSDSVLKSTKGSFADMMQAMMFEPLNMTQSGFYPRPADLLNFATGYSGGTAVPYYNVDWLNPAAGLFVLSLKAKIVPAPHFDFCF